MSQSEWRIRLRASATCRLYVTQVSDGHAYRRLSRGVAFLGSRPLLRHPLWKVESRLYGQWKLLRPQEGGWKERVLYQLSEVDLAVCSLVRLCRHRKKGLIQTKLVCLSVQFKTQGFNHLATLILYL